MDATWYVEHRGAWTPRVPCDDPRGFAARAARLADRGERGEVADAPHHPSALDPWASRLRREGGTGELVLVEQETGEPVARRDLLVPARDARTHYRVLSPGLATVAAGTASVGRGGRHFEAAARPAAGGRRRELLVRRGPTRATAQPDRARATFSASNRDRIASSGVAAGAASSHPYAAHTARSRSACSIASQVGRSL